MSDLPLYRKIALLRQALKTDRTRGDQISEKFLTIDGDYIGHQFCFERCDVTWKFDSDWIQVVRQNKATKQSVLSLLAEPEPMERRAA